MYISIVFNKSPSYMSFNASGHIETSNMLCYYLINIDLLALNRLSG